MEKKNVENEYSLSQTNSSNFLLNLIDGSQLSEDSNYVLKQIAEKSDLYTQKIEIGQSQKKCKKENNLEVIEESLSQISCSQSQKKNQAKEQQTENREKEKNENFEKFQTKSAKNQKFLLKEFKIKNLFDLDQNFVKEAENFFESQKQIYKIEKQDEEKEFQIEENPKNYEIEGYKIKSLFNFNQHKEPTIINDIQQEQEIFGKFKVKSLFNVNEDLLQKAKNLMDIKYNENENKIFNFKNFDKSKNVNDLTKINEEQKIQSIQNLTNKKKTPNVSRDIPKSKKKIKTLILKENELKFTKIPKIKNFMSKQFSQANLKFIYPNQKVKNSDLIEISEFEISFVLKQLKSLNENINIEKKWIEHHLRRIKFKYQFRQNLKLNKKQLKQNYSEEIFYRYWREFIKDEHSSIYKILQEKKFIQKKFCFIISNIILEKNFYEIELTDGWYCLYFKISLENFQQPFLELLKKGKLYPGRTVTIQNFQFEQEQKNLLSKNFVQIYFNTFFPAKNYPLGQIKDQYKPVKLKAIAEGGGMVPLIDIIVLKKSNVFLKIEEINLNLQMDDEDQIDQFMKDTEKTVQEVQNKFSFLIECLCFSQYQNLDKQKRYYSIQFQNVNLKLFQKIKENCRYLITQIFPSKKICDNFNINFGFKRKYLKLFRNFQSNIEKQKIQQSFPPEKQFLKKIISFLDKSNHLIQNNSLSLPLIFLEQKELSQFTNKNLFFFLNNIFFITTFHKMQYKNQLKKAKTIFVTDIKILSKTSLILNDLKINIFYFESNPFTSIIKNPKNDLITQYQLYQPEKQLSQFSPSHLSQILN